MAAAARRARRRAACWAGPSAAAAAAVAAAEGAAASPSPARRCRGAAASPAAWRRVPRRGAAAPPSQAARRAAAAAAAAAASRHRQAAPLAASALGAEASAAAACLRQGGRRGPPLQRWQRPASEQGQQHHQGAASCLLQAPVPRALGPRTPCTLDYSTPKLCAEMLLLTRGALMARQKPSLARPQRLLGLGCSGQRLKDSSPVAETEYTCSAMLAISHVHPLQLLNLVGWSWSTVCMWCRRARCAPETHAARRRMLRAPCARGMPPRRPLSSSSCPCFSAAPTTERIRRQWPAHRCCLAARCFIYTLPLRTT